VLDFVLRFSRLGVVQVDPRFIGLLSSVTLVSPDYAHDTTVSFSYSGGVVEERHFALVERFAFSNPGSPVIHSDLGYAHPNWIRIYGEEFDLTSIPIPEENSGWRYSGVARYSSGCFRNLTPPDLCSDGILTAHRVLRVVRALSLF
jgi:hypothetical protein